MTPLTYIDKQILAMLTDAAERNRPCPTNDAITAEMNWSHSADARNVLEKLKRRGLITVRTEHNKRMVTIVATGKSTASPFTVPRAVSEKERQRGRERSLTPSKRVSAPPPPVIYTVVSRDPCPACGVRGDVGCRHQRAQAPQQVAL